MMIAAIASTSQGRRRARSMWALVSVLLCVLPGPSVLAVEQAQPPPSDKPQEPVTALTDTGWPRSIATPQGTITIYQPQIDQWDGFKLQGRAAVEVAQPSAKEPVYGIVEFSAQTQVDKERRLVRALRGGLQHQPITLSTGGFGVNVSGVLVPRWAADDRIKFASNAGWGIGRYITDLGTLGGQDAVYDPATNQLRALRVSSGYFGYERQWKPTFTSTLTYGIVNVSNLDIQPGDALRRTQRTTINLTWTPIPQADIVIEFLAGTRVNKDGKSGTSSQVQAGWTFRF